MEHQKKLIANLIKKHGTQKAVAQYLGVSTRAVRYWSTGERELKGLALRAVEAEVTG